MDHGTGDHEDAGSASAALDSLIAAGRRMSAGDWSIVTIALRDGAHVVTHAGSAHGDFWATLVRMKWAEMLYSPMDPELFPGPEMRVYRAAHPALNMLPAVLFHAGLIGPQLPDRMQAGTLTRPRHLSRQSRSLGLVAAGSLGSCALLKLGGKGSAKDFAMLAVLAAIAGTLAHRRAVPADMTLGFARLVFAITGLVAALCTVLLAGQVSN